MRAIPFTLPVFALLASVSLAVAQQQPPPANQPTAKESDGPLSGGPIKSQQGGKEEPGSHASGANNDQNKDMAFVDGKLNVPGAPEDSQTVPSKHSKHNAEIDELPIMAMPLGLSEEQKKRIAGIIGKSNAPVEAVSAKPADMLPVATNAQEFSKDITAEIPGMSNVKFIRTGDKILLVRSSNMVVIDAITP